MNRSTCAIILAGGRGTRISHLYPQWPKPFIPVAGAPFIDWVVRHLASQGVARFVVSLGHLAEIGERHFAASPVAGVDLRTVRETAPLGTGGGFLLAEQASDGADPLLLANGDSLVLAELSPVWTLLENEDIDGVVVGLEMHDASRYGRLDLAADGTLLRFSEKQPGSGVINAGLYAFRRRTLEKFPRRQPLSMELDVFPALLEQGARIAVHRCRAPFLDIGTPESLRLADTFLAWNWPSPRAA